MQLKRNYNNTNPFIQDMMKLLEGAIKFCCVTSRGKYLPFSKQSFSEVASLFCRTKNLLLRTQNMTTLTSQLFIVLNTYYFLTKSEHVQSSKFLVFNFLLICIVILFQLFFNDFVVMNSEYLYACQFLFQLSITV